MRTIRLRGARTHNLQNLDLDLEPGSFVVVTGPSGAGKSSLAFSTLYAEGQRRYVESFSAYARQFLERLARPPVDSLEPVPAAIAVDRGAPVKTSRSTVATMTEVSDYAKQLWAGCAEPHCPRCGGEVRAHDSAQAASACIEAGDGPWLVSYGVALQDAEHYLAVREGLVADGFRRVWLGGARHDLDGLTPSRVLRGARREQEQRTLDVLVDRISPGSGARRRLSEAVASAQARGAGKARLWPVEGEARSYFSEAHCLDCGERVRRPTPGAFSFNSPVGACPECRGFGRVMAVDWDKVIPDETVSLKQGAIRPWKGNSTRHERGALARHCGRAKIPMDVPVGELSDAQRESLLQGDGKGWRSGFPGLRAWFRWLETKTYKMHVRVLLARYRKYDPCGVCSATRFKAESLSWTLAGHSIATFYKLSAEQALEFVQDVGPSQARDPAMKRVVDEIRGRLSLLHDVGLGYLTLDRTVRTLSGGELQRVGLTSALGSSLTGTLFVLDEPTVGLHPADVSRLQQAVARLAAADNVVLAVESDEQFLRGADRILELGPGSGSGGGCIVLDGSPAALARATTATGRYLRRKPRTMAERRSGSGWLRLTGATGRNLQGMDLELPLGAMSCITGVSGSGKSTLVTDTLHGAVARALGDMVQRPLPFEGLSGHEGLSEAVLVDQSPLGRTSRGNPATYLGAWDAIRKRLMREPLAKHREYSASTFSFNVAGGRCEACRGDGYETVEMQFLADVRFSCPECGGRRFVGPVLDVKLAEHDVAQLLELTADDALDVFASYPEVVKRLQPLHDVGAGYLRLGQPLNTLSGGEAQRLKLAGALAGDTDARLLILDEPTAGLHGDDVDPLLRCLQRLADAGHTLVLVEHDMRVAAACDRVLEMGPGAGSQGGQLVAVGTPEAVAAGSSATAPFLRQALGIDRPQRSRRRARSADTDKEGVIRVEGATEHNLRHLDVEIPREQLVVVTGPSGSGKSTLAFDVVYAEAQRRYLETLSPYVRQYLKQLPRPAVERVGGTPPAVSLEQRMTAGARNSTVATVTEVAHYMRLLYARIGQLHCPDCELPVAARSRAGVVASIRKGLGKGRVTLFAPVVRGRKGLHRDLLARLHRDGHRQARIDGELCSIEAGMKLDRYREHDIEVDVESVSTEGRALTEAVTRALKLGDGFLRATRGKRELALSTARACPGCGQGFPELDPRFFSFNTRQGACPTCEGAGQVEAPKGRARKKTKKKDAEPRICPDCDGGRLSGLALHTRVDDLNIGELFALDVSAASKRLARLKLSGRDREVGRLPLAEAVSRLGFLEQIGLGYLGLDRAAWSLSGGELQRVRLAAQLGSGLTGLLYVLDEPTIGLHPRDTGRLIDAMQGLVKRGCSVLVVEHDADVIRSADHVIDIGPGGGLNGGRLLAAGPPTELLDHPDSITGRALARAAHVPEQRRDAAGAARVSLRAATAHNLKGVDLEVPLGCLTAVTGVSGSGKSTLVREVFLPALRGALGFKERTPGGHGRIEGYAGLKRAVEIDQSPIGRTPRSVPATYVGVWNEVRRIYAGLPEARARGYDPSRFSFNVDKGRCTECQGQGATTAEMAFLPSALVHCERCDGRRFNDETLEVLLKGHSVGELLDMHVEQVAEVLSAFPKAKRPLDLLCELGLGYLKLGQPSNTLSGGEAQRLRLVSELGASSSGPALYVMDEPTTGLHRDDVERLLSLMQRLVDRGDTVVVIEHHPDVVLAADWVVDLGPEGGAGGGQVVARGTPEAIMANKGSHTGHAMRRELAR